MDKGKYVLGFDYGTLSCRIIAVNLENGNVAYTKSCDYPSGVISSRLPSGAELPSDSWFLQDGEDYLYVMQTLINGMFDNTGVASCDIVALGLDFTNCTVVAVDKSGKPMSALPEYKNNPHSYVKLWKHHAAQKYASELEEYMLNENTEWFCEYGRNVSSEWFFPKLIQVFTEDRAMYEATDVYMDATDYMVYALTGNIVRSSAILGVNAFYSEERGFPPDEFFNKLYPGFGTSVREKIRGDIKPVGSQAGHLSEAMANYLGLNTDVVVSVGHGDSEVAASGLGVCESGSMIMAMGTSTCYQMLYHEKKVFDGLCAVVKDGMIPGFYAYETGQPAVGDIFAWFAENLASAEYKKEAEENNISLLSLLNNKAEKLNVGESGLIALDWLNGNRSILMDYDLSGMVVGMNLQTKCEEMYRAFVEATAFNARRIFEEHENAGVHISSVYGAGGLPLKSDFIMQVYADILNKEITVPQIENSAALGACVCAAVALGSTNGGYDSFKDAQNALVKCEKVKYIPIPENAEKYNKLYKIYCKVHDYFGTESDIMHELNRIQQENS